MRKDHKIGLLSKESFKRFFWFALFYIFCSYPIFSQSLSVTSNLNLGSFFPGTSGGSFVLNTSNQRVSPTGTLVLYASTTSTLNLTWVAPGSGGKRTITTVTFNGGNSITLTRVGGGSMTFTFGTPLINGNPATTLPLQVNNSSSNTFVYGGTLTVGGSASNPGGTYNNTGFTVTLNYQ
ncbi:MAG TPA: hypothetical protein DF637_04560 [Rikenellaceae bacterium]|nr:hypothetical protein [Rikenellaceae bacterium]